jgi:hypothetical protein
MTVPQKRCTLLNNALDIANELAKEPDAAGVFLNKAIRTVTGTPTDPLRRPDVSLLSTDKSVTAVEVPSPSDSLTQLARRNLKTQLQLPAEQRGGLFIIHIPSNKKTP